ncbi:MAG: M23 family metallopeptidase [Acidobacteria bacterium]|nr:M23 family metallopeptidase [Acidobacteriota bacterium]
MKLGSTRSERSGKTRFVLVLLLALGLAFGAWYLLRVGPAPQVDLVNERPAVGRPQKVTALFSEPEVGLGTVRLELIQGDRTEILAEEVFDPGSGIPFIGEEGTEQALLEATVGTDTFDWLAEGEVVLRATAERSSGPLRRPAPAINERTLPVRTRPPRLEVVSTQHYGRQGGSGAIVYRVGEHVVRSGVRAGQVESPGSALPNGGSNDRFALYSLPWNVADDSEIRVFAEDDAGNRTEQPFLDIFKATQARTDTIRLNDTFFKRVVPAIAGQTQGFDVSGSLLDQFLRINGDLRRTELGRVADLSRASESAFLWSGAFLQMPNSARRANFAETRTYIYEDREVDRQTHLGLDLASTARAPVPAPNSGRVVFAGWMSLYGNAVIIDHGYGLLSLCGHMSTIDVTAGDAVAKGDRIGTSGATGMAGGDHLHLEIFVHGQSVDPMEWLDAKWIRDNLATKLDVPIQ